MDMIHSIVTKNDVDPDKIKLIEISPLSQTALRTARQMGM